MEAPYAGARKGNRKALWLPQPSERPMRKKGSARSCGTLYPIGSAKAAALFSVLLAVRLPQGLQRVR